MGRNIFQSDSPAAMIQAVVRVVHDDTRPEEAYEFFREQSAEKALT
jgi:putative autoinducer-2 (AI-2) aldolase